MRSRMDGAGRARRGLAAVGLVLALAVAVTAAAATATAQEEVVPAELGSARATMRTFLTAMHDASVSPDRLDDAVDCLDLSDFAGLGAPERRELAVDLKEIIDRTRFVEYEELPDEPDAPPYVFLRERGGEVVLAGGSDRAWRFTGRTVASIPALLRTAQTRERVEGAAEGPAYTSPSTWVRQHVPASFRRVGFLLEHWQWLGLLAIALFGVFVDRIAVWFTVHFAKPLAKRLVPLAEEGLLERSARPLGVLAMAVFWRFAVPWLGLPPQALSILLVAITFLLAASGVWAAYRLIDVLAEYFAERASETATKYDDLLIPLIRKSLKIFLVAFGLVFIADNLDVDITSLVAGLGLGGLAFALAAQDVARNLFGSITVLLDRPFHVGDWVVIGDTEGTVEEVGFRSTRVRTFYDSLITVPNANLLNSPVDNLGARRYRRWKTTLSLTYDTPPDKMEAFCEGVREIVRQHPHTRKNYFHVYANEFGAASLNVLLYVFFETPDWSAELRERHRLFLDILRMAERIGVEFAFPTQTLHLLRPGEMPDHGDPLGIEEALEKGRGIGREIGSGDGESYRPAPGQHVDPTAGGDSSG